MDIQLGAFTRPWAMVEYEEAVAHLGKAFRFGGIMRNNKKLAITLDSTPEQAQAAVAAARRNGVELVCFLAQAPGIKQGAEQAAGEFRRNIDLAAAAGVPHILATGAGDPALADAYAQALRLAAPYAAEKGVTLGLKPHGGITRTGKDCRRFAEEVRSKGFGLWFDPGNFIHYDDLDPVEELKPMAEFCVGMCVKDCGRKPDGKPDVLVQPGSGRVDFPACLRILKDAGFRGPMLFECLAGSTVAEVDANAVAAKKWFEGIWSSV
ncbi:MAG: sugar phosphate isomerase/epimerase [Candidatus Sumerlaeota bacterium]|nr:sugar phosphate isomerase/epimerase [Candidatus Sumerlaeota bacterium]